MNDKVVDYYFAPVSPWTYLGHERFVALLQANAATCRLYPVDLSKVFFTAEGGFGRAAGKTGVINGEAVPCTAASCLVYRGAYLLGGWRATTWLTPYARVDWRSGTMRQARDWAYESIRVRATAGVRVEPVRHLTIKAEYTLNRELLGADFPDDVFTTSVIVSY